MRNAHAAAAQPTLFAWKPPRKKKAPRPNGFARALAIVVQYGKQSRGEPPVSTPEPVPHKQCPRCQRTGRVDVLFGTRVVRGELKPQSWCRDCRRVTAPPRPTPQLDLLASAWAAGSGDPAGGRFR